MGRNIWNQELRNSGREKRKRRQQNFSPNSKTERRVWTQFFDRLSEIALQRDVLVVGMQAEKTEGGNGFLQLLSARILRQLNTLIFGVGVRSRRKLTADIGNNSVGFPEFLIKFPFSLQPFP
jgi:hypothetical protein